MVQQMDSDYCVLADTSRRVRRSSLGMEEEDNLQSYCSPFLADRGTVVGASYSYHTLVVYKLEALKNAGNMEHLQKSFDKRPVISNAGNMERLRKRFW